MSVVGYSIAICVLSNIIVSSLFIPLVICNTKLLEPLYKMIHQSKYNLQILKSYKDIAQKNRIKIFLGLLINLVLTMFAFYFSFNFCAVWKEWRNSLVAGWIASVFIDAVFFEIGIELFISILYCFKKNNDKK